jgi:O-antigen/teichoic acid export membrane protein
LNQQFEGKPALPGQGDDDEELAPAPIRALRGGRMGVLPKIMGYGMSRTIVEGLLAGRGVALASILGPEAFGIWALFQMGLRYCAFSGLGLLRGLEVEVVRAGSDGEQPYSSKQAYWGEIASGYTFWLYGPLSVVAGLSWLWWGDRRVGLALLGVALGLLLDRLWMYGLTFLRAAGGLRRFAVLELVQAAAQLALGSALALVWGVAGAFVGFAIANLAGVGLLARRVPLRLRTGRDAVRHLLRIGFPVSVAGILTATLATADRLIVGAFDGMSALGTYAFAVSLSSLGVSLALVVRTVILTEVYGEQENGGESASGQLLLDRTLAVFSTLVPSLAGVAALCLAPAVTLLLPQFQAAVPVAQTFVFTGTMQGLVNVAILGIVAADRQHLLPVWSIGAVLLNVGLSLFALSAGFGLVGVAIGAWFTRMLYAGAILTLLGTRERDRGGKLAGAKLLAPSLWCAAVVGVISYLVPLQDPKMLLIALPFYAAAVAPLIPRIGRALAAVHRTGQSSLRSRS